MKVTFPAAQLIAVLKDVARVATSKTTMFRYVLIEANADEDRVDFTASSESVSLKRTLYQRFGEQTVNIAVSGVVLIPAQELLDFVKFASSEVSFEQDDVNLKVRFGKADVKIQGEVPEKFNPYRNQDETSRVELSAPVLRKVIGDVSYACATSEARPVLTGVNFKIADSKMVAVATDGLRLAKTSAGNVSMESLEARNLTIPGEPLKQLSTMLPKDEDEMVVLEIGERVLVASWGDGETRLTMRALDGPFPDCERIIPQSTKATLQFNREELLRTVELVSLVAGDSEQHRSIFEVENGQLTVSAQSQKGTVSDSAPLMNSEATIERMGFNISYWLHALKSIHSELITVGVNGPLQAVTITNTEDNSLSLISPVRLYAQSEQQKSA